VKYCVPFLLALAPLAVAAERDEPWVIKRIREIRESDTDAWRKIPWTNTLLDAARLAAKEERPMFLFSHEGNLDTGRC
jgi:hypothetical protein